MANNVTYVMMHLGDDDGREQSHLLGALHEVYATPFSVGRDPSCDVIIDHPSVPPRAAEFSGGSNHRFVRWPGAEMRERIDGSPVRIGAFRVQLVEVREPRRHARPPAGIAVRFGPRGLGAVLAADVPEDPRSVEAHRIADALDHPTDQILRLDDPGVEWCEERLRLHFAALSWATSPMRPLSLTRVEYTGSLDDAIARWRREWAAAEARPFHHVTWSHVHRYARWRSDLGQARSSDLHHAEDYAGALHDLLLEPFANTTRELVAAHLATLDDDISPARPLADLLVRGVYALALPDAAMLLYLAPAAEHDRRSSDPVERDFVDALADDRVRLVYGDYLEQRGELARADAIRARGGPSIGSPPHFAFGGARALLLLERRDPSAPPPLVPDTSVPAARLEVGGDVHALGSRTALAWRNGRVVVGPSSEDAAAILTQAGGALWLTLGRGHAVVDVNHHTPYNRRQPLFDGDLITLRDTSAIVRL